MNDYASFADKPLTLCRRVADVPKKKLKVYTRVHGARVTACACCGARVLAAPSSMRQQKERGVPLICDACGAEIALRCRRGCHFALAPGALEELHRAHLMPGDERLN